MTHHLVNGSPLFWTQRINLPRNFCRYKSITAAIERGRSGRPDRPFRPRSRAFQDIENDRPARTRYEAKFERFGPPSDSGSGRFQEDRPRTRTFYPPTNHHVTFDKGRAQEEANGRFSGSSSAYLSDTREAPRERFSRENFAHSRNVADGQSSESRISRRTDTRAGPRERFGGGQYRETAGGKSRIEVKRKSVQGPESLPYTTAASEFIYGHSSVLAAIKANRRKFYKLYVHSRGASRDGLMSQIRAHKLFPITEEVGDEYLRAMDKASSGRPHNGVILESSPLPVPPITELKTVSVQDESFSVALGRQSAEDVLVNGKQELYTYRSGGWRHPLVLYVDGVVDEGNLGAIARSAYVLGADAVVTPTHHTANWSHIAVKASAGAAEAMALFQVGEATDFLGKSSRAGWRIYASDAVARNLSGSMSSAEATDTECGGVVYTMARSTKRLPSGHSPVAEHPTIVMMGAEGTGLRASLLNLAHYKVGIPHGRGVNEVGVDSLNVSVAASILCYEMLQRPRAQPKRDAEEALF